MWASYGDAIPVEDPRAGRALAALDRHEVLERDRDAQQRVEGVQRGAPLARARLRAGASARVGLGQRALAVDASARRAGRGPGARPGRDARPRDRARTTSPDRRRAAISWAWSRVRSRHRGARSVAAEDRRHDDRTRRRAPARWPAPPRRGSDGLATSSRRMFSSSIVWAVGAMWSVGTVARIAYWSRMWLSWPSSRSSSSSVRPSRARWATCSTSARDRVAMRPMIAAAMPTPRLRPMTAADLEPTVAAILADDWGDRRALVRRSPLTLAGLSRVRRRGRRRQIVGTGVATINGPVGLDRHDLGRARASRARAGPRADRRRPSTPPRRPAAGRSSSWRPTAAGRCTSGLGFEVQTWYRTMEAPGLARRGRRARFDRRIRPFRAEDLDSIAALDRAATGEDRRRRHRRAGGPGRDACPRARRGHRRVRHPRPVGRRGHGRAARRGCARHPARASGRRRSRQARALRDPRREQRRRRRPRGGRLDRGLAGAPAHPRRAAGLAARPDLGSVQPRDGLAPDLSADPRVPVGPSDGGMVVWFFCRDPMRR